MGKNYIPYGRHDITKSDIDKVIKVLQSQNLTQGHEVPEFEKQISLKVKSKYSVAVNSATSALHLACLALNLKKDDYLWTSPISFVASANCGLYCGAKIDFVDINPETGLIDLNALEQKLKLAKSTNKLPKIIVAVHLAGTSCDMRIIKKLSDKYGFQVIEDASHAIGGYFENHPVGSCEFSKICVFSFHPVKIITTGEGGICTTNDEKIFNKINLLRSHGIEKNVKMFKSDPKGSWSYEQQYLGFNYRMTDIQAALGLSQLKRLDEIVEKRNQIFQIYKQYFEELPVNLLNIPKNVRSSLHLAIIRLYNKDPKFHKYVFEELRTRGIGVQLHYSPIHLHPFYKELGFEEGNFPESENYSNNAFSIPLFPTLKKSEQIKVINTLKKILKEI